MKSEKYKSFTYLSTCFKINNSNYILLYQLCKVALTRPNVPVGNYVIQFTVLFSFSLKYLKMNI